VEASGQNLRLFDEKLAQSVEGLERRGLLPGLLAAGGSPPFVMASTPANAEQAGELPMLKQRTVPRTQFPFL